MMAPALQTPRLHLVPPQDGHLAAFVDFYASPRAALRGWQRDPAQAQGFWDVLTQHWADRGFGWFVILDQTTRAPIGMCGPWESPVMPEGELAWSLWQDRDEGKGLAFEAASAARDFAFRDLGWSTAVSYIAFDNLRSIALARRLGAMHDGEWTTPKGAVVGVYRHPRPEALQ
jgi:RimJ/RimL family protein N-acetyltransferase